MNDLIVLENGLVPVYQDEKHNENLVNARDLYVFLESKQQFTDWIKNRIKKCMLDENEDYFSFHKNMKRENGASVRKEFFLTLDSAKEVAMIESNHKGKAARKYFIQVEKKFREQNQQKPLDWNTMKIMVDEQARLENQTKDLEKKVEKMTFFLTSTPKRSQVTHKVREYSRMTGIEVGSIYAKVQGIIKDKYGVDVQRRVENRRQKLNNERLKAGKKLYKESTLIQKVNGMDIIVELNLEKEFLEILAGMIVKEKVVH